jgi:hypothetical protein
MTNRVRLIFLTTLSIIGLLLWYLRPGFDRAEFPKHGENFVSQGLPVEVGQRQDFCSFLQKDAGYLLISGEINFEIDAIIGGFFKTRDRSLGQIPTFQESSPYGLFQSSDLETGLFFEFDPGENYLLRFGFHQSDGSVVRLKFFEINRHGPIHFAILIKGDGLIRMIGDGIDFSTTVEKMEIDCSNFRIAAANGLEGIDGEIEVTISAGANVGKAQRILDEYRSLSNERLPSTLYKWPLYAGVLLLVIGNPRVWRKK